MISTAGRKPSTLPRRPYGWCAKYTSVWKPIVLHTSNTNMAYTVQFTHLVQRQDWGYGQQVCTTTVWTIIGVMHIFNACTGDCTDASIPMKCLGKLWGNCRAEVPHAQRKFRMHSHVCKHGRQANAVGLARWCA